MVAPQQLDSKRRKQLDWPTRTTSSVSSQMASKQMVRQVLLLFSCCCDCSNLLISGIRLTLCSGRTVGERGVQLSGGQKQRIAIARGTSGCASRAEKCDFASFLFFVHAPCPLSPAVVRKPALLLLDEATSGKLGFLSCREKRVPDLMSHFVSAIAALDAGTFRILEATTLGLKGFCGSLVFLNRIRASCPGRIGYTAEDKF